MQASRLSRIREGYKALVLSKAPEREHSKAVSASHAEAIDNQGLGRVPLCEDEGAML